MKRKQTFLFRNGLSITLIALCIICLTGQAITGWHEHNSELAENGAAAIGFVSYLSSYHFIQATFENWESEFLQMAAYVLLTIFLFQKGSSESKSLTDKEDVDRDPNPRKKDAPWPVKKGGIYLAIYNYSLSIAFALLFFFSFCLHTYGSLNLYNQEQAYKNQPPTTLPEYLVTSRLWFESFQNWQSEFIAVTAIVLLSIYLRQKGSPESKPVDAPHAETKG